MLGKHVVPALESEEGTREAQEEVVRGGFLTRFSHWYSQEPVAHGLIIVGAVLIVVGALRAIVMAPDSPGARWPWATCVIGLGMVIVGLVLSRYS